MFLCFLNSNTIAISVPERVDKDESHIIKNCKYICYQIPAHRICNVLAQNAGKAMFIGYTYDQSQETSYAQFLYLAIGTNDVFSCRCYDGIWTIKLLKLE